MPSEGRADFEMIREVGALREAVTRMTDQWAKQEEQASSARKQLYERFEKLSLQFTELKTQFGRMLTDVSLMQPTIRKFEDGQQQLKGMSRLGKVIWAAAVAIAGIIGWAVSEIFGGAPPHH